MIHDAKVEVTCDGKDCMESLTIEPDYVYSTYSGGGGRYDTSDSAIEEKISLSGWTVSNGKHFCEDCKTDNAEEGEEEESEIAE